MNDVFKYLSDYSQTQDMLSIKKIGDLLYMKIDSQVNNHSNAIIIPNDEIPSLIQYLQGILEDEK